MELSSSTGGDAQVPWFVKVGAVVAFAFILLIGFFVFSYYEVPEGHTGVERQFGAVTGNTYQPGAAVIAPWKNIQYVEIREREVSWVRDKEEGQKAKRDAVRVKSVNGTKHHVDVTVRYKVKRGEEAEFIKRWGSHDQFVKRVLRPDVRSTVYQTGGTIKSSNIHKGTGRKRLEQAATKAARDAVANEPVEITSVQVRDVTVPRPLAKKYNQRESAKIAVEKKEHEVQAERKEAKRKKIEARANAKVIEIKGKAIRNNPEILDLRRIEAVKNNPNTVYIPVGQEWTMTKEVNSSDGS